MSLRNRILLMVLVLMASAVIAADLVTSSEVHAFLISRLDDADHRSAQDQLLGYVDHVYTTDVSQGDAVAKTDPAAWLDEMDAVPGVHQRLTFRRDHPVDYHGLIGRRTLESHLSGLFVELIDTNRTRRLRAPDRPARLADPAPQLPATCSPRRVRTPEARDVPAGQPAFSVGAVGSPSTQYRVEAASVPGGAWS